MKIHLPSRTLSRWLRAALIALPLTFSMILSPADAATATKTSVKKVSVKTIKKKIAAKTTKKASRKATSKKAVKTKVMRTVKADRKRPARAAPQAMLPVPLPASAEQAAERIASSAAMVVDQLTGAVLMEKKPDASLPIASITKLMTAMIVLDARQNLDDVLTVTREDIDFVKHSSSKLPVGSKISRRDMLRLALMASENRAASALARHYPGGRDAFVQAMNIKAKLIGLDHARFYDSTGLNAGNRASAKDLVNLVSVASSYPLIKAYSTAVEHTVALNHHERRFGNTNRLVKYDSWDIELQKTGYISEAGKCLVMQARIQDRPVIIVLLDAPNSSSRLTDATRIRDWINQGSIKEKLLVASL